MSPLSARRLWPEPPASASDLEVEAYLHEVDRLLAPRLQKALERVPNSDPLRRALAQQVFGGGKRLRAALCVAACELFGTPYHRGLDFAVAIEHIHNFTLVHDDIADGDPERRMRETIWKQYGVAHGINIGDGFVPLAALAILSAPYVDRTKIRLLDALAEYSLQMVDGQNMDLNLRGRDAVSVAEYLECARKKTAALVAMATVGGGIIAGAAPVDLRCLHDFAMLAGVAFQVRDDLLDLNGHKGRARGSDVFEGKRTLMVAHALPHLSAEQRERLFAILNAPRETTSPADVEWVWRIYAATRAVEFAERTAAGLIDRAIRALHPLPESQAKHRFRRLARYMASRTR